MEATCPDCHEECTAIIIDNGIGWYEFWGARCFDSKPEVVSNCCEAFLEGITQEEAAEDEYV